MTITVALSRGTLTSISGRAAASPSNANAHNIEAAGACRRHPGRRGASRSSMGREAKRTA